MNDKELNARLLPALDDLSKAIRRGQAAFNAGELIGFTLVGTNTLNELLLAAEMWRAQAAAVWQKTS